MTASEDTNPPSLINPIEAAAKRFMDKLWQDTEKDLRRDLEDSATKGRFPHSEIEQRIEAEAEKLKPHQARWCLSLAEALFVRNPEPFIRLLRYGDELNKVTRRWFESETGIQLRGLKGEDKVRTILAWAGQSAAEADAAVSQ